MQQSNGYLWWGFEYTKAQRYPAKGRLTLKSDNGGEHVMERLFTEDNPSVVQVKMGVTLNMDNFESIRVDAGLSLPCDPENVNEAYDKAYELVQDKLQEKAQKFKEDFMR